MDNDFKTLYNTLRAEQDALKAKMQSARGDAIKHVQELIDAFQIQSHDLNLKTLRLLSVTLPFVAVVPPP